MNYIDIERIQKNMMIIIRRKRQRTSTTNAWGLSEIDINFYISLSSLLKIKTVTPPPKNNNTIIIIIHTEKKIPDKRTKCGREIWVITLKMIC